MSLSRYKRMYYRRLEKGLCPRCGGPRGEEKWLHCPACLERNRKNQMNVSKEKSAQYIRDYKKRNKLKGLCPKCGREPVPGRVLCEIHSRSGS